MKALLDRIRKDGKCYPYGILKVDKFINHQMDPNLMKQIAVEIIRRYAHTEINKILTIEASGIAPAIMMGFLLDLPVVFAKKKKPSTMDNVLSTTVFSFTKQREYHVVISKDYLTPDDKVLFVDDFLAYGNAAKGIIDLCQQGRSWWAWRSSSRRLSSMAGRSSRMLAYVARAWLLSTRSTTVK